MRSTGARMFRGSGPAVRSLPVLQWPLAGCKMEEVARLRWARVSVRPSRRTIPAALRPPGRWGRRVRHSGPVSFPGSAIGLPGRPPPSTPGGGCLYRARAVPGSWLTDAAPSYPLRAAGAWPVAGDYMRWCSLGMTAEDAECSRAGASSAVMNAPVGPAGVVDQSFAVVQHLLPRARELVPAAVGS
jgi:hypothetical protein